MLTSTVSHNLTTIYTSSATFRTHCYNLGESLYSGLLDELRFSNAALTESELLISEPPTKGSVFIVR